LLSSEKAVVVERPTPYATTDGKSSVFPYKKKKKHEKALLLLLSEKDVFCSTLNTFNFDLIQRSFFMG